MVSLVALLWVASAGQPGSQANKKVVIRPYVAPKLDPEPELAPSDVKVVEIVRPNADMGWNVLARPWYGAPMVGQVLRGARIGVRGQVQVKNGHGCTSKLYYALEPFGYLCSRETRHTDKPATTEH